MSGNNLNWIDGVLSEQIPFLECPACHEPGYLPTKEDQRIAIETFLRRPTHRMPGTSRRGHFREVKVDVVVSVLR